MPDVPQSICAHLGAAQEGGKHRHETGVRDAEPGADPEQQGPNHDEEEDRDNQSGGGCSEASLPPHKALFPPQRLS